MIFAAGNSSRLTEADTQFATQTMRPPTGDAREPASEPSRRAVPKRRCRPVLSLGRDRLGGFKHELGGIPSLHHREDLLAEQLERAELLLGRTDHER